MTDWTKERDRLATDYAMKHPALAPSRRTAFEAGWDARDVEIKAQFTELEAEVAELWGSAKDLLNACDQVNFSHDGEYPVRAHRMARLRKALAHTPASRTELQAARDRVVEAAKLTIARADDYADSYITRPIREAIQALEKLEKGKP